jgi:GGDEF domain-containing protein
MDIGHSKISITVSIGAAVGIRPSAELVKQADAALYRSRPRDAIG